MTAVFDLYAAYYDLLYRDKDYRAESLYLDGLLRDGLPGPQRVLELGCGTGGHALELAKLGHTVAGIDLSPAMVELAEQRRAAAGALAAQLRFGVGDARRYRAGETFDAVVSLFHVMSYQTTNEDLLAAFATARAHLRPGGLFVFDAWYGPAVLSDRPRHVERQVGDDRIDVHRKTTPTVHVNDNCVDVRFDIEIVARDGGARREVSELHRMRYLFVPELRQFLASSGFELVAQHAWLTREAPDDKRWYACFVARAIER